MLKVVNRPSDCASARVALSDKSCLPGMSLSIGLLGVESTKHEMETIRNNLDNFRVRHHSLYPELLSTDSKRPTPYQQLCPD